MLAAVTDGVYACCMPASKLAVLIVEDEKKVAMLIQKLIDWDGLELSLSGVCEDGLVALAAIDERRPAIVVTDIRMPGIDGLELINRAKKLDPRIRFVVVSGYREFEYAQTALKHHVDDYLLKPVRKEDLNSALTRICVELRATSPEKTLRASLDESRELLRRQFMKRALDFDTLPGPEELEELASQGQIPLDVAEVRAFFVLPMPRISIRDELSYGVLLGKAAKSGQRAFEHGEAIALSLADRDGVFLFVFSREPQSDLSARVRALKEEVDILLESVDGGRTVICGSPARNRVKELPVLALAVYHGALDLTCAEGNGIGEARPDERSESSAFAEAASKHELATAMETLNAEGFDRWLDQVVSSAPPLSPSCLHLVANLALDALLGTLPSDVPQDLDIERARKDLHRAMTRAERIDAAIDDLRAAVRAILGRLVEYRKNKNSPSVLAVMEYTRDHYDQPIGLEDMAKLVRLTPAYLGTLFKKETGVNFTDYLIERRIEAAKSLLRESDAKLEAITKRIGYTEVKYFQRLFRSKVGITPGEYRKLNR